jgi:hypothetical protein
MELYLIYLKSIMVQITQAGIWPAISLQRNMSSVDGSEEYNSHTGTLNDKFKIEHTCTPVRVNILS